MKYRAIGGKLVVKPLATKDFQKTKSGIFLPKSGRLLKFGIAEVLECASCKKLVGLVNPGDHVLYEEGADNLFPPLEEGVRLVREEDVDAIFDPKLTDLS